MFKGGNNAAINCAFHWQTQQLSTILSSDRLNKPVRIFTIHDGKNKLAYWVYNLLLKNKKHLLQFKLRISFIILLRLLISKRDALTNF